jgi:cytochrome c oxidase subunit 2
MTGERVARLLVLAAVVGPLGVALGGRLWGGQGSAVVEVHARMASEGGWGPGEITVGVGDSLRVRLVSDDVTHGFAVGHTTIPPVDLKPGIPEEVTLRFDRPGTYTFYCTRWCGVNHWRMRGTIVVTDEAGETGETGETGKRTDEDPVPLVLDLDLDAPHPAAAVPSVPPDPARGRRLLAELPDVNRDPEELRRVSPADTFLRLRADPKHAHRTDRELWNLVAALGLSAGSPAQRRVGGELFAANCAACHGEQGDGRGVMAPALAANLPPSSMPGRGKPADFTDRRNMLGASSALLAGKILRGGMGTGMPNWGAILTDEQVRALVAYVWTFSLSYHQP